MRLPIATDFDSFDPDNAFEMDGLAATRAIRALPGTAQLPIVALTANAAGTRAENILARWMRPFETSYTHSISSVPRPSGKLRVINSQSTTTFATTVRDSSRACRSGSANRARNRSRICAWPCARRSPCSTYCSASGA